MTMVLVWQGGDTSYAVKSHQGVIICKVGAKVTLSERRLTGGKV